MSILLIDGGNTLAKWKLCEKDEFHLIAEGDFCYQDAGSCRIDWALVSRVYVADVSGKLLVYLQALIPCHLAVAEVVSTAYLLGVTNSYQEVERLGVDRFLSAVEAYNRYGKACCVIDIGTAAKIDVVNDEGLHLGGYIVPGLALSEAALMGGTRKVRFSSDEVGVDALTYGVDTASAVSNGCLSMMVAWIDAVAGEFKKEYPSGLVLIAGGGSERVVSHLSVGVELVEGLVLSALCRIAKQASE